MINNVYYPDYGVNETVTPKPVRLLDLDPDLINTLTEVKRYVGTATTNGVDISANFHILGNLISMDDLWLNSETAAVGTYYVNVKVQDPSGTPKVEFNTHFTIV